MDNLPEYVLSLLDKIALDEGFTDVIKDFKSGCNHGDNFFGASTSVVLRGRRNGTDDGLHLLCKLAPEHVHRRAAFDSANVFKREAFSYNHILPTFLEFQRAAGVSADECFSAYPKCYAALANVETDRFIVIMEDLRPGGFLMRPKAEPTDLEHSLLTMEQLGRFHGVSFALKDQQPDAFAKFMQLEDPISGMMKSPIISRAMEVSYRRAEKALSDAEHSTKVKELTTNWREVLTYCGSAESTRFAVVTHGDVWGNNLLFTYDPEGKVQTISFVDWKMCHCASPAIDILYNIFNTTVGCLRAEAHQSLLQHYHRSLSSTIRQLGSDPEQLFTFDDLQNELKRFGKYAIVTTPVMLRIILADPTEIRDYDQLKSSEVDTKDGQNHYRLNDDADAAFRQRYSAVVSDVISYGYY